MNDAIKNLLAAAKQAHSLLVAGDGTFNLQSDKLLRAIAAAEAFMEPVEPVREEGFILCGACNREVPIRGDGSWYDYCPHCTRPIKRPA